MRSATELSTRVFPARFADRTLAGYEATTPEQRKALGAAWMLANGEYQSLVLVGPPGVGKTHLAAGIVHVIQDREDAAYVAARDATTDRWPAIPESPMWVNVADLLVTLRSEMHGPMDDRQGATTVYLLRKHPALVVLDDLGREKVSDWTGETVYALVNARYENRLPTLVTSNLTPAELAASPYWPAVSRLAEDGALVDLTGRDRRLRA